MIVSIVKVFQVGMGLLLIAVFAYATAYWVLIENQMLYREPLSQLIFRSEGIPCSTGSNTIKIEGFFQPAKHVHHHFFVLPRIRKAWVGEWVAPNGDSLIIRQEGSCQYRFGAIEGQGVGTFQVSGGFGGEWTDRGALHRLSASADPIHSLAADSPAIDLFLEISYPSLKGFEERVHSIMFQRP